jgi:LacI family transcriptional regulator
VLAANDTLALGVARVALSMGLEIPRQLAICGIDDIEFSEVFSPSLTTVSLRSRERGRLAAQLLLDRMDNPRRPARTLSVEPRLVVRESTSARRRR